MPQRAGSRRRRLWQALCTVPDGSDRFLPATANYDPARDGPLVTCQRYDSEILFQDGVVAQRSVHGPPASAAAGSGGGAAADCPPGTICRCEWGKERPSEGGSARVGEGVPE